MDTVAALSSTTTEQSQELSIAMESILINLAIIAVITWLVMSWVEWRVQRRLEAIAMVLQAIQATQTDALIVPLRVEEVDGMIYGWHASTEEFVCQGRDARELGRNFSMRFPAQLASVVEGPEELLTRLRAQTAVSHTEQGVS